MPSPVLRIHRGVYVAQWDEDGKRVRRSLGTNDKAEAGRRLEHIKLTNAVIDRNTQKTVEELFEAYLTKLELQGKSTERWRTVWKYLSNTFGTIYPQYITPEMCLEYSKIRGVAPGTLNLELGLLRSILIHAYKHRLIPNAIYVPVPTKPAPKSDYIGRDAFKKLLGASAAPHIRLFLILAISTGARSNALLDLTWDRVSLEQRTIDLRLPGSASRKGRAVVPINDTALRYLTEAYSVRTTEYVIEYHSKRVLKIRNSIRIISKRVGLNVTPHVLRHSAAVWMAEGGVPMSEIAQYLGHSNTAITERVYARYSPGYLRKAASHLEIEE